MSNIKVFFTFLLFLVLYSSKGYSQAFDHAYIENFALQAIQEQLTVPENGQASIIVKKLDPRIKIKSCQHPLISNIPEVKRSRNVNIKITCTDSIPWKLYLQAKISINIPVLVAKQAIDKGTLLDEDNMMLVFKDSQKIRGTHLNNSSLVIGSKAKRKISKGRAITRKNICMVCKGDNVSIIAHSKHFVIKTLGVALSNGSLGDQIRIKNVRSGKIISAKVKAINKVVINL